MWDRPENTDTCIICDKPYSPHRPNQVTCGSKKSKCAIEYAKRKAKYNSSAQAYHDKREAAFKVDTTIASFISSHPTTIQEVFKDESVPNCGIVRDNNSSPSIDLHSIHNKRRVRSKETIY